ncbi:signal transduction histidine kinase [Mycetocola sp. CAN_C7]|uniref:sensor histidine kinase n=1 Tax=Mycetocola sp. CAN_C7 TaxID=2787724 RepID=UPI0018CB0B77
MKSLFAKIGALISVNQPSPLLKHVPTVIALVVAVLVTLFEQNVPVTQPVAFVGSILVGTFSVVLAYAFGRRPVSREWATAVPLAALLAIALLRVGTGGASSLFSSLIILPVIWIAAEEGRRWIAVAGLGTAVAVMMPFMMLGEVPDSQTEWVRGIIAPFVFTVVAAVINEMSRQNRVQFASIHALAEERERSLTDAHEQSDRLHLSGLELRKANELSGSVLDAVTVQAIIGTDLRGMITVWNPGAAAMLGRSADDTIGRTSILDLHREDELESRSRELNYPPGATVLNPGFSALVESARLGIGEIHDWTYRRSDGSEFPVEVAVTPRIDTTGASTGYIFVATDITDSVEVSRLKDEFVGLVSHELRTPLSSILGYLELMKDEDGAPLSATQQLYLGVAERNAHRLLGLVGDLLFTAQAGSGGFPLTVGDVAAGELVTSAVDSARPMAEAAGVRLTAQGASSPLVISGDRGRLGQAVDNLVSNAIKFTPRGGTVRVGLVEPSGRGPLEITISDTGIGIPAAELDQLFTRFFRATTATANAVPGVGLGLVITKAIVQAHGGELDVASVEGDGTVFTMRLPSTPA